MIRPPPISTLFPYPTLFRSIVVNVRYSWRVPARFLPFQHRSGKKIKKKTEKTREKNTTYIPTDKKRNKKRSEEHTSELQSPCNLVCRLLLEKKKNNKTHYTN